jgi:hypothetical protein
MRVLHRKMTTTRGVKLTAMLDRHKMMMRRSTNRNAHIITPHGKVMVGRTGRKG